MKSEIRSQTQYWNNEAGAFQKIYSHQKPALSNFLDRVFRQDMFARFEFTLRRSEPIGGRTFLDVGCGSGYYSVALAQRGASKVVGLDIAANMLDMCKESARQIGVEKVCEFVQSDLLDYSPAMKFQVTIGIGLFDYIRDPLPVLSKMKEVTSDRIIASFPRLWTWRAPLRKARLSMRGCDVYFYSRREIIQLMEHAGFTAVDIKRVGKLFCVVGAVR